MPVFTCLICSYINGERVVQAIIRVRAEPARSKPTSRLPAATFAVLLLCLSGVFTAAEAADVPPGAAITSQGTTILKNGQPWIPKGVVVVGFVAPPGHLLPAYAAAASRWGAGELAGIAAYGADLVRFQVSQFGLDPKSSIYSAGYADSVVQAVRLARANGFAVIVSMQSERPAGLIDDRGLPNHSTLRAWKTLAPSLFADHGIMFELFNEPSKTREHPLSADPTWADWLSAHLPILNWIRQSGGTNAVIVDGLRWAQTLAGAPAINDLNLIYAVHPYETQSSQSSAEWDTAFGDFAQTHPVLITEWNTLRKGRCNPNTPSVAAALLQYAGAHRIGVVGWAFDLSNTLLRDDGKPTTLRGFACDVRRPFGAGELITQSFQAR